MNEHSFHWHRFSIETPHYNPVRMMLKETTYNAVPTITHI